MDDEGSIGVMKHGRNLFVEKIEVRFDLDGVDDDEDEMVVQLVPPTMDSLNKELNSRYCCNSGMLGCRQKDLRNNGIRRRRSSACSERKEGPHSIKY